MNLLRRQFIRKIFLSPGIWLGAFLILVFIPVLPQAYEGTSASAQKGLVMPISFSVIFTSMTIAIMGSWGSVFSNIRTSSVMKRLSVSKYTKWNLIANSLIPLFMVVSIMTLIWTFAIYIFSDVTGIIEQFAWSDIDVLPFITFYIINIVTAIGMSFIFMSYSKTTFLYQSFVWLYVVFILLFSGSTMPIYFFRNIDNPVISGWDTVAVFKGISSALPQSYVNFAIVGIISKPFSEGGFFLFDWNTSQAQLQILIPSLTALFTLLIGLFNVRKWSLN